MLSRIIVRVSTLRGAAALSTRPPFTSCRSSLVVVLATRKQERSIHSTTVVPAAKRVRHRPRRNSLRESDDDVEENDEDSDSKPSGVRHSAVTDPQRFKEAGSELIQKLYTALQPMERSNDPFILTRGEEEDFGEFLLLDLGPVIGHYTIQVDLQQGIVILQSPISGQVAYVLSESTGEWVGKDDGHALEGLLVRDLIRQCNGLPNL